MSSPLRTIRPVAGVVANAPRRSMSSSPRLAAAAEVKRLGVVGAGQMVWCEAFGLGCRVHTLTFGGKGLGIALVAAQKAQIPVTLVDSSQASLDKSLKFAGMRTKTQASHQHSQVLIVARQVA